MQGGLGLAFLEGDRAAIDGAWEALGRVLPRLHAVGGGDFHVEAGTVEELEAVLCDLALIGWAAHAPDVAPGTTGGSGTPDTEGGAPWR